MTVDVSKQVTYAVLQTNDLAVSKQVAYAVVSQDQAAVSKQVAYAVLAPGQLQVSKQVAYAVLLFVPSGTVLLPRIYAEPIVGGNPNVRLPRSVAEPITGGNPNVRLPRVIVEPVSGGNPSIRCPLIGIEVFYAIPEEVPVPTDVLPTRQAFEAPLTVTPLPGLAWSVHKKPNFRTQINPAVSGNETRTARMRYPIWEYELTFEFLDDRGGKTQMETLMGFFLTQRGSWGSWLFQDWNDYMLRGQALGTADGGTTGFLVMHSIGGFSEPIGQFDLTDLFSFVPGDVTVITDSITVADHGLTSGFGPLQLTTAGVLPDGLDPLTNYWVIRINDSTIKLALSYADAIANTPVAIIDAGTGTFLASNSVAVYVDGTQIAPADYVVTDPNQIVFDTAPSSGAITIDCKYFYVCRFLEDVQDYEQFMDNLWTNETVSFQSIPFDGAVP